MNLTDTIRYYNMDCMEGMAQFPDKHFELAIVDPPYGIGISSNPVRQKHENKKWDNATPTYKYFAELMRISKNQIIWGGNYFPLPPTQGFIFWYKQNPVDNFSDGEFAWTSFERPAKCFDFRYYGGLSGNTKAEDKIHPTQKPIRLYEWLLMNYAKEGDKILDTHVGSGSSMIACHKMGFDFTGYELDKDYYEESIKRFKLVTSQQSIF